MPRLSSHMLEDDSKDSAERSVSSRKVRLEVPSLNAQQRRKEVLVERMLKNQPPTSLSTCKVDASSLLGRVKEFLPQIEMANRQLESMKEEAIVDCVPNNSESYIEMNVCFYTDSEDSVDEEENLGTLESNMKSGVRSNSSNPLVQDFKDSHDFEQGKQ